MMTSEECRIKAAQARGYAADTVDQAYKINFMLMAAVWDQNQVVAAWQEGWYAAHPNVTPFHS